MLRRSFLASLLLGVGRVLGADTSAYWKAKAAAAVALQPVDPPAAPPQTESSGDQAGETPPEKPVVVMYTATWCGPCQRAKAELAKADLPFRIVYQDVSNGSQPDWCTSLPAFGWDMQGQTRYVLGWPGTERLIQRWRLTVRQAPFIRNTGYSPRWTWPGDLRHHLVHVHRQSITGLSADQMEYLHDCLHEGRTA